MAIEIKLTRHQALLLSQACEYRVVELDEIGMKREASALERVSEKIDRELMK